MSNRTHLPPQATVAVVGLGKIGLPLATQYALHGWHVIGCDINPEVVASLNRGRSHVQEEPELEHEVPRLVAEGRLSATTDTTEAVRRAQVIVVIVPIIITETHAIDFATIDAATIAVGAGLQPGTLVIYETTMPIGTTSRRLARLLEESSHLQAGQDFLLAYSPERVSSGTIFRDLRIYPKIVGGIDERSTQAALNFYQSVLDAALITMSSTEEAEFVKLIETTYRDVNIALANEFACYADRHGLNVISAIAAANTQPYSHIHTPGVGVGGHCIPVYPYFLLAGTQKPAPHEAADTETTAISGFHYPLLMLPRYARQVNDGMALYAVDRIKAHLGSLDGLGVLILGVAYRRDVRETAFTSARLLQDALLHSGAQVYVDDPLFSEDELLQAGYAPLLPEQIGNIHAIILQAGHRAYQDFDFRRFPNCRVVLDGRMALQREALEATGIHYIAIGDGGKQQTDRTSEASAIAVAALEREE